MRTILLLLVSGCLCVSAAMPWGRRIFTDTLHFVQPLWWLISFGNSFSLWRKRRTRAHGRISHRLCMYILMVGGEAVSLLQTTAFTRLCGILSCTALTRLHFNAHSAQVRFGAYPSIRLRYNVSSEMGSVRMTKHCGPFGFLHLHLSTWILLSWFWQLCDLFWK